MWRCSSATWRACDRRFRLNRDGLRGSWRGSRLTSDSSTVRVSEVFNSPVASPHHMSDRIPSLNLSTTVQQWILQEKKRLTTIEQRITQDSGVQTDLVPAPLLERLVNQASGDQAGQTADRPSLVVRTRKKVVQEELLKHHALCRAESRIRRKRLRYQLERIARKRHLLEAKKELQRLERALPLGPDSPGCPEPESPSKVRGRSFVSRRHSFSADLLSRLYPQNTPIFR